MGGWWEGVCEVGGEVVGSCGGEGGTWVVGRDGGGVAGGRGCEVGGEGGSWVVGRDGGGCGWWEEVEGVGSCARVSLNQRRILFGQHQSLPCPKLEPVTCGWLQPKQV